MEKITLEITNSKASRKTFKDIIDKYHSYMNYSRVPTRRIDWLIYNLETGDEIGAIGINSAVLNLGPRDYMFPLKNRLDKCSKLKHFCNNYRFCLTPNSRDIQNVGSQVLKHLRHLAKKHWEYKYGNKLLAIETFVKQSHTGAIYKADNWLYLGLTKGWSFRKLPAKMITAKNLITEKIKFKKKHTGTLKNETLSIKRTDQKHIFFKPLVKNIKEEYSKLEQEV